MADSKIFSDYIIKSRNGDYSDSDILKLSFLSNSFDNINTDVANPNIISFAIASGGNVAASYTLAGVSFTRIGAITTLDATDIGNIVKNASNPADIMTAILYNDTSGGDCIQFWDMTSDRTTPYDAVNNDLNFKFGASGINQEVNWNS